MPLPKKPVRVRQPSPESTMLGSYRKRFGVEEGAGPIVLRKEESELSQSESEEESASDSGVEQEPVKGKAKSQKPKPKSASESRGSSFGGFSDGDEDGQDKEEDEEEDGEDTDDEESMDIDEPIRLPKDAEEEELERLVFGDTQGFRQGLQNFSLADAARGLDLGKGGEDNDEENKEGLDDVADEQLFYFDAGPTPAPGGASLALVKAGEETADEGDKPAWEDSDDERLVVSLVSVPRLRKLRETEDDDMVNGREYVRRLRKQYQRLYPTPEWAVQANGKAKRKRGRKSGEIGESDESAASDMDVDSEDEDLATQPLAKLLKDADLLARVSAGPAKRRKLQAGTVDIQRLKDVAGKGPAAITSLSFHPTYPLLLSSGPSSTLSLHHVSPSNPLQPNPLLTTLHIKNTPLTTTAFHPSPSDPRIFLSARRRYFHIWDLSSGSVSKVTRVYGHAHEQRTMETFSLSPNGLYMALKGSSRKGGGVINILDAKTLQWLTQVRIESRGGVADFAWWGDANGLTIAGKSGEITEWSLLKQRILARWTDEGAVGTTVLSLGGRSGREGWLGGDRWVAVGSSSGIVNIYDRRTWYDDARPSDPSSSSSDEPPLNHGIPSNPTPLKALTHLTTPISHLAFSPDGQILAMSSRWKHSALRLVHLPSATVFKNWPTDKTPLGRISAVAWGRPPAEEEREGSLAYLAVGLETGRIRLWEVKV